MSAVTQGSPASESNTAGGSPLSAFNGEISPTRVSLLYKAGLAVVAFAMVLLPLIYLALIGLTCWGVYYHIVFNHWLLEGQGNGLNKLITYVGPAAAGSILILFMVKPLFARRPNLNEPLSLDPRQEPLLFAFIARICGLVRAPMPCRVDVDCQVNAFASLRRGLLSNDLVLTIGLPLAGGLDMRQFAGVLAHEFGHFAQGAGMRLTYIVRHINHWFARVVYERDKWDISLERTAKSVDLRLGVVFHAARGCVWLTRRLLWALMHAGNAISCFMLRQMEYDADSYEAKVAGSDVFAPTSLRLQTLNLAMQEAYGDLRQSWTGKRLPENFPLLIQHKATSLPADVQNKLREAVTKHKTGIFDTHPCDADRARAVAALNEPGVFRLTEPTAGLFSNFEELSRVVTRHHYGKDLELEFAEENLVSSEQALRESQANAEAGAAIRKFYGEVDITHQPLFTDGAASQPLLDVAATRAQLPQARERTEQLRPAAEDASKQGYEDRGKLVNLTNAHSLLRAGFRINAKEFNLPPNATSIAEQSSVVEQQLKEITAAVSNDTAKLEEFMGAVRTRVSLALQSLQSPDLAGRIEAAPALQTEAQSLRLLLGRLGAVMPLLHETGLKLQGFALLVQNRGNHSQPTQVDSEISVLAKALSEAIQQMQSRLRDVPYPFRHAGGELTVAEYAKHGKPSSHEWEAIFNNSNSHLERLFALHYRVLGRLLVIADSVEKQIGA